MSIGRREEGGQDKDAEDEAGGERDDVKGVAQEGAVELEERKENK